MKVTEVFIEINYNLLQLINFLLIMAAVQSCEPLHWFTGNGGNIADITVNPSSEITFRTYLYGRRTG